MSFEKKMDRKNGWAVTHSKRQGECLLIQAEGAEVRPGKQSSSSHGMPALWELIDSLQLESRPHAI